MNRISLVTAKEIGVEPALIRGHENLGLTYFTWSDSPSIGVQCSSCNSILWLDPRRNDVLNEIKPDVIPNSGPAYTAYFHERQRRFLNALPACPVCNKNTYDRVINNVTFPRFLNGSELPKGVSSDKIIKQDPAAVEVWYMK